MLHDLDYIRLTREQGRTGLVLSFAKLLLVASVIAGWNIS